jgi:adenylylsulfate reductase subunit B
VSLKPNPDSVMTKEITMPPVIDHEKCTLCGTCSEHCPLDVIYMGEKTVDVRYPDECWHCGVCRQDCSEGAVSIDFPLVMLKV